MKQQLEGYQKRVNHTLEAFLKTQTNCPETLQKAISYATLNQGKRLRPALVYAVAEAFHIPLEQVDSLAASIELIHSYSLVHDDLPAMDDDDLRRGQPTCHIAFDEATAILVGDAQLTYAFEIITQANILSAETKVAAIQLLTQAAGAKGMIAGQHIDILSEGFLPEEHQLKQMHLLKTGKLIQAALLLGAITQPEYRSFLPGLVNLGEKIGLAFQVHDDILDIESTTEALGKPQGSDEAANKSTYPKLMGLNTAKNYRDTLIQNAHQDLAELKLSSPFLTQLIDYIANRTY